MNNVYDTLEICLQELEKGADVETVLFRYPEHADELRPLLEAAARARGHSAPDPSPEVVHRSRAKVLQRAAQMREAQAHTSRRMWSVPLRRALVSLAVILVLFLTGTGLVRAASATLPGDNLYPVKRTWEDIRLLFIINTQAREALEIEHENERLEELYELFAKGRTAKVDFAGFVTRQNGELWLVSKIPVVITSQTDVRDPSIGVGSAIRVRGYSQPDGTVLADRVELVPAGKALPRADDDELPEIEQEETDNENEAGEDRSGRGSGSEPGDGKVTQTPRAISTAEKRSLNGIVDSISGTILVVNGQPLNIASAEVKGTPRVGASVKAEGYIDARGVFIVTKIEFLKSGSGQDGDSNSNVHTGDDSNNNDGSDDNRNDNDNSGKDDNDGTDDNSNDDNSGDGD